MTPQDTYHLMATIAFPAAALWALVQWYQSIRQRREELRWKRAEAAWRLMDEVFNDPQVAIAFDLVDGETSSIEVPGGGVEPVSAADIATALDPGNVDGTPRARAIRDAFNCVLYSLDRLEGAIQSGYVLEEDVDAPTRYYARLLRGIGPGMRRYATEVGYDRALALILRLGRQPG